MAFNAKKFIKFLNTGKWDKAGSFFHEELSYVDPFCAEPLQGKEVVLKVMQEQAALFPDSEYEPMRVLNDGNHYVVELVRKGNTINWNQVEYKTPFSLNVVLLIDVEEDLIRTYQGFFDVSRILRIIDRESRKTMN